MAVWETSAQAKSIEQRSAKCVYEPEGGMRLSKVQTRTAVAKLDNNAD